MAYVGFKKMVKGGMSPALAAHIGRKKYGKKRFQKAAAKGKKMKGMPTAKEQGSALES